MSSSKKPRIEFTCPFCAEELSADFDQLGQSVVCTGCEQPVTVRLPDDEGIFNDPKTVGASELGQDNKDSAKEKDFEFDFDAVSANEIEQIVNKELAPFLPAPEIAAEAREETPVRPDPKKIERPVFGLQEASAELNADLLADLPGEPVFFIGESAVDTDSLAPLRLDDLEASLSATDTAAVVCKICDTRIIIPKSQLSGKIKCPECFSEFEAVEQVPRSRTEWQKPAVDIMEPKNDLPTDDGELRLSDPIQVERFKYGLHEGLSGKSSDREFSDPEGKLHGDVGEELAPIPLSKTPLSRQNAYPENDDDSELQLEGERLDDVEVIEEAQTNQPPVIKPKSPSATNVSALIDEEARQAANEPKPQAKFAPYQPTTTLVDDPQELEKENNPLGMNLESLGGFDGKNLTWIFQLGRDPQLLVRLALIAVCLTLSYWLFDRVWNSWNDKTATSAGQTLYFVFCGGPGLLAFLFGWIFMFAVGGILFEVGGDKKPYYAEWINTTPMEYLPKIANLLFGFWLASLPGAAFGMILWFATKNPIGFGIAGTLSAMFFSPLLYLSASYNGSAFKVVSTKVLNEIFEGKNTHWLRFLPGSIGASIMMTIGILLLLVDSFLFCLLGAMLQVAAFTLFASFSGLFVGLMTDELNKMESRKNVAEEGNEKSSKQRKPESSR